MAASSRSDRGLSESTGVAVLILFTVLGTMSVGMSVFLLTEDDDSELGTNFNFQHQENLNLLLVFYDDGPELRAGNLFIDGPANNVSWAELRELEPDAMVSPGGPPLRVGENTAYGKSVGEESYFEVRYTRPDGGEQLVLATFGEPEGGSEGDGPIEGDPGGGEPGEEPGDGEPGEGP